MTGLPPFMDLFAFHLAARLLSADRVKEALTKSHSLRWRSRCKHIGPNPSITPHLYFTDVSFHFGRNQNDNKGQVEICFGALISRPGKNESYKEALYVQSSPWQLSDLENYTLNTGICVEETGPEGMANIIASSMTNLDTAHVSKYYAASSSEDDSKGKLCIELEHCILNEGVKLLLNAPQTEEDGFVGSVALSMLIQTMTQDDDEKTELNLHNHKHLFDDERHFINWWKENDSFEKSESFKTDSQNQLVNATPIHTESNESSRCHEAVVEVEQKQVPIDNTSKRTIPICDNSFSKTTNSNKRPGVLHGVVRNKKRKKGKLTFGQI